jgi:hypothetical protein
MLGNALGTSCPLPGWGRGRQLEAFAARLKMRKMEILGWLLDCAQWNEAPEDWRVPVALERQP